MNVRDAVETMLVALKDDDAALFTTGYISRHAFSIKDRPKNFYMIGSMGLVSSVGLGLALNTSKRVFIFDGDGSALMDLGTMAMIAGSKAEGLFHLVFDNESYESTGAQPTISSSVDLAEIARAAGYETVFKFNEPGKFENSINKILSSNGPVFVLLKSKPSKESKISGRISITPQRLTQRMMEGIAD